MNKYEERLLKEWEQHGKVVIAADYDSTIYPWHTVDNMEDINRTVKVSVGFDQVLHYVQLILTYYYLKE